MKPNGMTTVIGGLVASMMLVSCGGGGSDSGSVKPPIVGTDAAVQGTKILDFSGATSAPIGFAFGDGVKVADVTTATYYEVTGSLANTGVGFGAVVAAFDVPASQRDWASATTLSIRIAGSQTTTKVRIELEKNGAVENGCNPLLELAVTTQLLTFDIDLTAANFALPSFCTPNATNPTLPSVLPDVRRITVSDRTLPSTGTRTVGVRLGEIGLVGLGAVSPGTPPAPVQGTKILDVAGGTATPISFSLGDGVKVSDTTTPTYYEVTGTLANTGVGFGSVVAAFDLPLVQKNWTSATKLSVQLAGAQTTSKLTIELEKTGAVANGCNPYVEQAVTPQLTTYTIDLTAANFVLPAFCTANASNPAVPGVLPDVRRISVSDKTLPSSGTRRVGVRLGNMGVVGLSGG